MTQFMKKSLQSSGPVNDLINTVISADNDVSLNDNESNHITAVRGIQSQSSAGYPVDFGGDTNETKSSAGNTADVGRHTIESQSTAGNPVGFGGIDSNNADINDPVASIEDGEDSFKDSALAIKLRQNGLDWIMPHLTDLDCIMKGYSGRGS